MGGTFPNALCLIAVGAHEDPARSAIDGHKQIASTGLIGHLRQVLDVDVSAPRLIVFKGLPDGFLPFYCRDQILKIFTPSYTALCSA